jgi:hypothetical protein
VPVWNESVPWLIEMFASAGSMLAATKEIWFAPVFVRLNALPPVESVAPVPRTSSDRSRRGCVAAERDLLSARWSAARRC